MFRKLKQNRTQNTEHRTQNTEHGTQNTEHRTQNTEHRIRNTEYGTQNTEHRTRNTEHRMQNTEHRTQNTEHRTQNTEHGTPNTEHMLNLKTTLYIVGLTAVYALVRWIRSRPLPPDPWDNVSVNHEHDDVIDIKAKEIPVCTNCLQPIFDKRQHYCPKCGNVTGDFTRYIPFVNIQFGYSIFSTMWKNIKSDTVPTHKRLVTLLVALMILPVVVLPIWLFGLIIAVFEKIQKNKKRS